MFINHEGNRFPLDSAEWLTHWHAVYIEEWSEPFGRWVRTDRVLNVKPGESVGRLLNAYATEQGIPFHNVRGYVPE